MKLIVNADDFGLNEETTLAIADAFEQRFCSNTTIMVNMPYAEKAVEIAKERGIFDKIGLHINLSEGSPITSDIQKIPIFCGSNGFFNRYFHFHRAEIKRRLNELEVAAVQKEVQAQIDRYKSFGFTQFHADSHHHTHHYSLVSKYIEYLLVANGFVSMRPYFNIPSPERSKIRGIAKVLVRSMKNASLRRHIKVCDYFGTPRQFAANIKRFKDSDSVELMIHPRYNRFPEREMDNYKTPMIESFNAYSAFPLVSYNEL